jgi:hypothetical protein
MDQEQVLVADEAQPLIFIRRRGPGDWILDEWRGDTWSWLKDFGESFASAQAAEETLRARGLTPAVRCPDCERGYLNLTEPCQRCRQGYLASD